MAYTEIFKLKRMLEEAEIPFVFSDNVYDGKYILHIQYPNALDEERVCSVVQGYGTYGSDVDMLEILGLLTKKESRRDVVAGWLSAENVFKRIQKHYKNWRNKNE